MKNYIFRFCLSLGLIIMLTACGGGGSSSTIDNPPPTNTSFSTISLAKTVLQMNETTTVTAKFVDTTGKPASGITVTFSTTLGTLNPSSGQVVTDATGSASIQLMVGGSTSTGIVTATAVVGGRQVSKSASYSVNLPPLHLSSPTLGLSTLSYGGSTSVSVRILDSNGVDYTSQDVDVLFTSTQVVAGKATLPQSVRSVNGIATATYKANTVIGADTITISLGDSVVQTSLTVNPADASSVQYISAVPVNIGLKGMGGAGIQETSVVTFKVIDVYGQPRSNQLVNFALNTTVGGLSLVSYSGSTDSNGLVSTIVKAGTIATPVRVTATLVGVSPTIATQSDQLVVSTGVPSQDGFSISVQTLNVEGWNIDGVTSRLTARLSDHFHNPVPDGTAVYFTTEGGSVQSSCSTVSGSCSVLWTSQNPRPADGRATVLAYAIGEESFTDLNGNGVADAGEFTDMTGAFRDDNENGVWDSLTEAPIPFFNATGYDPADGKYNGVLQGAAYTTAPKSKHVFSNSVIVMASSSPSVVSFSPNTVTRAPLPYNGPVQSNLVLTVLGSNGNAMPAGTKIEVISWTTTAYNLYVDPVAGTFVVPNTTLTGQDITTFNVPVSCYSTTAGSEQLTVRITSPSGVVTIKNILISY